MEILDMTGFQSKRVVTLDTLDHMPYQGRPTRPEELAQANPCRDAIDNALICAQIGTVDSYPTADQALEALIDWHVAVALDPEVSSDAQALVDRGAAAPVPAVTEDDMADDGGCPVCGADGGTSCGMPNCGLLSAAPVQSEPVAYTYDIASYREGDVRGRGWVPTISRIRPTQDWMLRDVVPLYAAPVPAVQSAAKAIAEEQSYDPSLWFVATTVTEAHLQTALRRLAAAVEGEPVARTPLTDEQVWTLATQCTIGGDLHIDKFARAIEAAHGIGETT
jgi:hypothetical protein